MGNLWNFAGSTCGGKAWSGIDRCHVMTWERFSRKICTIGSWMNVRKIHRHCKINRSCTPSSTRGRESSLETSLPSETSYNNLAAGKHGTKSEPGRPSCARRKRARYESVACRTVASHSAVQFVSSLLVALLVSLINASQVKSHIATWTKNLTYIRPFL